VHLSSPLSSQLILITLLNVTFCPMAMGATSTQAPSAPILIDAAPPAPKYPPIPIHVDGNIRSYYFTRDFGTSNPNIKDQSSFSLGGKINALTDAFWGGFKIGATLYTAQSLGLNSDNFQTQDRTLPGSPITVLGQTYGQFKNDRILARLGNQIIRTSWMNDADSRMIPAIYQGLYVEATVLPGWDLVGMRTISFKGRPNSHFTKTNLYDEEDLGTVEPALHNKTDIGALAVGSTYEYKKSVRGNAWLYHWYNFANLAYADVRYYHINSTKYTPYFGLQVGDEWNDGSEILNSIGLGQTKAQIFGALIGMKAWDGKISISMNYLPKYSGAFQNGDVVSPYTSGYLSDPLFTTSMISGLIEKAAGTAFKITAEYNFFDQAVNVIMSYAKYNTQPFIHNTDETDFDVTFRPRGLFKNLSIRNRIGFLNGNQRVGHFVYNRFMLEYDFLDKTAT
jgi:hypothetical protein